MQKSFFTEFDEISAQQWKQKIQFELEGSAYQNLLYHSLDGIDVKPFYHPDDAIQNITIPANQEWKICDQIYVVSEEISNYRALKMIENGAESLWFIIPSEETDLEKLFKNFNFELIPVYLKCNFFSENFLKHLHDFFQQKNAKVYLQLDPIGNFTKTGNWFYNEKKDLAILEKTLQYSSDFESVISVDTMLYQNAGASIPQQLAYALAHANEYLHQIYTSNFIPEANQKKYKLQFLVAIGPNYFFEMAKIRALRWLFANLANTYKFNLDIFILAKPSKRNKTIYDNKMNLLRTTTESTSAVLGGADAVNNLPYDTVFHKNNKKTNQLARNQLLHIKYSAQLNNSKNQVEGAFYIDYLTQQFAEKAWAIFKNIEKGNGFLQQLKEGIIQKKIKESATKEQSKFDAGELVLIGTNTMQNTAEKMQHEIQLYPFLKKNPRKTLIEPILERRLSEKIEKNRLQIEQNR